MGFSEASVRERSAWLAPELVDLCHAYFQKPVHPDEVPDVDGDPFTDSQEYPKSFSVGRPSVSDRSGSAAPTRGGRSSTPG